MYKIHGTPFSSWQEPKNIYTSNKTQNSTLTHENGVTENRNGTGRLRVGIGNIGESLLHMNLWAGDNTGTEWKSFSLLAHAVIGFG